ncbi:MAG: hypothetical protein LBN21_04455, partial [Treponema sp.]|nr:hypothetical protein [Treponema sp.]
MGNLFIIYIALTVFGLGITIVDFLGVFDHPADDDDPGDGEHTAHHGSQVEGGDSGLRILTGILGFLRMAVYFALGAGPTGLFALLTGLDPGKSLIWSVAVGGGIAILTRLLRKFLRR